MRTVSTDRIVEQLLLLITKHGDTATVIDRIVKEQRNGRK